MSSALASTMLQSANQPLALTANSPIGVFDSGVGGLSVLMHLLKLLPYENYYYLADTLHVPYGSRSETDIKQLTLQAVDWLKQQGCKLIVIACNSASAFGLDEARKYCPDIPIVGLVPALKPAVSQSKTRQVAVLATPATLSGRLLNQVIDSIATPAQVKVHKYSIASLVPWVEAGMPSKHIAVDELENLLYELCDKSIDQLVLGCTHYPFFKQYLNDKIQHINFSQLPAFQVNYATKNSMMDTDSAIKKQDCQSIGLIDSGLAIARRVQSLLSKNQLITSQTVTKELQFFSTANLSATMPVAKRLIHQFAPDWRLQFHAIHDPLLG